MEQTAHSLLLCRPLISLLHDQSGDDQSELSLPQDVNVKSWLLVDCWAPPPPLSFRRRSSAIRVLMPPLPSVDCRFSSLPFVCSSCLFGYECDHIHIGLWFRGGSGPSRFDSPETD